MTLFKPYSFPDERVERMQAISGQKCLSDDFAIILVGEARISVTLLNDLKLIDEPLHLMQILKS